MSIKVKEGLSGRVWRVRWGRIGVPDRSMIPGIQFFRLFPIRGVRKVEVGGVVVEVRRGGLERPIMEFRSRGLLILGPELSACVTCLEGGEIMRC